MSSRRLARRAMLRGAGGVAVGLPLLEAMLPQHARAATVPRRLVIFYSANGTIPTSWLPQGTGTAFTLSRILEPLAAHKGQLLVLSGLNMETANRDGGNQHARGMAHMLTARKYVIDKSLPIGGNLPVGYAGGISIDQEIAKTVGATTRFRSLELGVATTKEWGAHPYSRMCYLGRLQPVPAQESPKAAFDRLFAGGAPGPGADPAATGDRVRAQRRSVLDFVRDDFATLAPRVGVGDRQKLEAHVTALRELERSLAEMPATTVCARPAPIGQGPSTDNAQVPAIGKAHMDVIAAALACDLTRVASLQWGSAQSNIVHRWADVGSIHHGISHQPDSNAGAAESLVKINRWFAGQLAYLASALKARAEAGGTLLDSSAILWCSEVSVGNTHSFNGMPYVVVGSCGGALQTGRHLQFRGTPHGNLLVALGRAMGVRQMQTFGEPEYCTGALPILNDA